MAPLSKTTVIGYGCESLKGDYENTPMKSFEGSSWALDNLDEIVKSRHSREFISRSPYVLSREESLFIKTENKTISPIETFGDDGFSRGGSI